jgi:hypothetical protein
MIHRCDRDRGYGRVHDDSHGRGYDYDHGDCEMNDHDHDARENIFYVQHLLSTLIEQ